VSKYGAAADFWFAVALCAPHHLVVAEAEQQLNEPLYGDDRCGVGSVSEGVPPSLSNVERVLLQLRTGPDHGAADVQQLQAWHDRFKGAVIKVASLEQLASAATLQYLDAQGVFFHCSTAVAIFHGHMTNCHSCHVVRQHPCHVLSVT